MTLCLQILKSELQSCKRRNVTLRAGSSLSLMLVRCHSHTVLCMEALLEICNLQVGFSIFSNPGVAKPFWWKSQDHFVRSHHVVLFMTQQIRPMSHCLSLLFQPLALACAHRNVTVCA